MLVLQVDVVDFGFVGRVTAFFAHVHLERNKSVLSRRLICHPTTDDSPLCDALCRRTGAERHGLLGSATPGNSVA